MLDIYLCIDRITILQTTHKRIGQKNEMKTNKRTKNEYDHKKERAGKKQNRMYIIGFEMNP